MAKKPFKIDPLRKFSRKEGTLQGFLTEIQVYLLYNRDSLLEAVDQILAASTRLEGSVFDWFKPRVREYIELKPAKHSMEINKMFTSYNYFTEELGKVFGDIDKKKSATHKLL
jgi:hypothetical protein